VILGALIWLAVAGLVAIGAGAILAPVALSRLYGAPVTAPSAIVYVRAAGVRDVLIAIVLAVAQMHGSAPVVTAALAAGALLALADFVLTLGAAGRRFRPEHLSHLAGFAGFAVLVYLSTRA